MEYIVGSIHFPPPFPQKSSSSQSYILPLKKSTKCNYWAQWCAWVWGCKHRQPTKKRDFTISRSQQPPKASQLGVGPHVPSHDLGLLSLGLSDRIQGSGKLVACKYYMQINMCVCLCVYVCVCVFMTVCLYVCMPVCVSVCACLCVYMCVCMPVCSCVYVHICACVLR